MIKFCVCVFFTGWVCGILTERAVTKWERKKNFPRAVKELQNIINIEVQKRQKIV